MKNPDFFKQSVTLFKVYKKVEADSIILIINCLSNLLDMVDIGTIQYNI